MNTRVGHHPVKLDDDGFVLTEKLAAELGVRAGDAVTLTEQDAIGNATGTSYEATVTGIVENYVYHYAYMGPALYEQLMGKAPDYRTVLAVTTSDPDLRVQFSNDLLAAGGVKTVAYNDETIDAYRDMMSSVNMIVVVLVTAAAALAFIVLYNLTNINITERMREIATLKVLGFTPREMNATSSARYSSWRLSAARSVSCWACGWKASSWSRPRWTRSCSAVPYTRPASCWRFC